MPHSSRIHNPSKKSLAAVETEQELAKQAQRAFTGAKQEPNTAKKPCALLKKALGDEPLTKVQYVANLANKKTGVVPSGRVVAPLPRDALMEVQNTVARPSPPGLSQVAHRPAAQAPTVVPPSRPHASAVSNIRRKTYRVPPLVNMPPTFTSLEGNNRSATPTHAFDTDSELLNIDNDESFCDFSCLLGSLPVVRSSPEPISTPLSILPWLYQRVFRVDLITLYQNLSAI